MRCWKVYYNDGEIKVYTELYVDVLWEPAGIRIAYSTGSYIFIPFTSIKKITSEVKDDAKGS